MKSKSVMLIAGEPSGDTLGAELVEALRTELTAAEVEYTPDLQPLHTGLEPHFFGAGGPRMAAAGVDLAVDLTKYSITGIPSPKEYLIGRGNFNHLWQLAIKRQPDVIVGIDYNYFNLKFAHAVRQYCGGRSGWFQDWRPKLVKYISPQLWASREGRAGQLARDYDLVLSIFPFEKEWYAKRVPKLGVEFVGHPMLDRLPRIETKQAGDPVILLLPGSREGELAAHLPVMLRALEVIRSKLPNAKSRLVLPNDELAQFARSLGCNGEIQIGNLPHALQQADIAIASTGTVTMECAFFGLPAVTIYKKRLLGLALRMGIIKSKWFTMPNILADEEVYPEFLQSAATPENISRAALELLQNETRRNALRTKLAQVVASLGGPGASKRAARAIVELLQTPNRPL